MTEYLFIPLSYLLGAVPFGLILSFVAGHGDIRKIGSGNIGATNVLRTGNKKLAIATLLCDAGKGAVAVLVSLAYMGDFFVDPKFVVYFSGLAVILGHMFPVWLLFKGGKGVATALGTMLAISPLLGIYMCLIWLGVAFLLRYSSLAALTAFAAAPAIAYFSFENFNLALFSGIIAALVFWRHKENILRLLKGQESKINLGAKKTPPPGKERGKAQDA